MNENEEPFVPQEILELINILNKTYPTLVDVLMDSTVYKNNGRLNKDKLKRKLKINEYKLQELLFQARDLIKEYDDR